MVLAEELTETKEASLSSGELGDALQSFSDADWLRLRKAANFLSSRLSLSADDLINEAVIKALSGDRKCPRDVEPIVFLLNAMRSITHNESVKAANLNVSDGEDIDSIGNGSESSANNALDAKCLLQKIEALFADDDECTLLLMALADDLTKQEIMGVMEVSTTAYETIRKRFRRTIDKHFPKGLQL